MQTQFGWHVIKVLDRRTAEPTFDESEPQLRQDLAREIVTALVADLREDAEIERFNLDGTPCQRRPKASDAPPAGAAQRAGDRAAARRRRPSEAGARSAPPAMTTARSPLAPARFPGSAARSRACASPPAPPGCAIAAGPT